MYMYIRVCARTMNTVSSRLFWKEVRISDAMRELSCTASLEEEDIGQRGRGGEGDSKARNEILNVPFPEASIQNLIFIRL
jgi:hypothetical protein